MNIHIQESWLQDNGKYKCPFCEREFSKNGIATHIWRIHGDGKQHKPLSIAKESGKTLKPWNTGKILKNLDDVFVKGSNYRSSHLKNWILSECLIDYVCSECGNTGEHNNKQLTLELDHINGDNTDNRLNNLRFLCPNCHSQTPTFRGRGKTQNRRTDVEIIDALRNNDNIYQALKSLDMSPSGGNHLRAKKLLSKI